MASPNDAGVGEERRLSRRSLLGGAAATGVAIAAARAIVLGVPSAAAAGDPVVGSATTGLTSMEMVGKIDQDGDAFIGYGYLTFIHGLTRSELFAGTPHSESTARFTTHSPVSLVARTAIGQVFTLDLKGEMSIYFNPDGGASFDHPISFKQGKLIASAKLTLQDVLSVVAPNEGVPVLQGDLQQTAANPFSLGGTTYHLGRVGLLSRFSGSGKGVRTNASPPRSNLDLGANIVVVGQA